MSTVNFHVRFAEGNSESIRGPVEIVETSCPVNFCPVSSCRVSVCACIRIKNTGVSPSANNVPLKPAAALCFEVYLRCLFFKSSG